MGSHNTGREVRAPDCHECVKLNVHRTKAQRTLHCDNHACPAIDADGRKCGRKKRKSEYGCEDHPPPPPPPRACEADGCRLPPLKRSPYCHLHTCTFPDCQKFSNPASGMDFCVDHRCSAPRCQSLRKRNQIDDHLVLAFFCRPHECETDECSAQKVAGKNHCEAHCCTVADCPSARNPVLGTRCLAHYNEQVGTEAAARREAEIKANLRARAQAEAIKRAEALKQAEDIRQAKLEREQREHEAEQKILRSYKAKLEEDEERKLRDERKQKEEQEAAEREREKREMDERRKYQTQRQWEKSPRSSGSHFYENPADHQTQYNPSSPRNGEPSFEIPHRTRTKRTPESHEDERNTGRGEYRRSERERRRSGDSYVHVHHGEDDDEAYHSAADSYDPYHDGHGYLRPGTGSSKQRARGSSNASTSGSGGGFGSRYRNERGYHRDETSKRAPTTEHGGYVYDDERQAKRERERQREREKERERENERDRNVKSGRGW